MGRYLNIPDHHLCIGHLALSNVTFSFIKHPHFLQVWEVCLKNSHVSHMANLLICNSLSDLGWVGSNKSKKFTSLTAFLFASNSSSL